MEWFIVWKYFSLPDDDHDALNKLCVFVVNREGVCAVTFYFKFSTVSKQSHHSLTTKKKWFLKITWSLTSWECPRLERRNHLMTENEYNPQQCSLLCNGLLEKQKNLSKIECSYKYFGRCLAEHSCFIVEHPVFKVLILWHVK